METKVNESGFRGLDKSLRIQKITATAAGLFHRKGYRSTTLDDVSKELGITKAALYHYVSSKEKLLSRIYIQALENIFRNTDKIAGKDLPPDVRLRLIIQNHIKGIVIQSISMFSVFFTEENQLPEKEFRKIRREKRKYTQIVEGIIEEGISQGLFKKTDPKLQAFAIIGMCNWVYKWYKPGHNPFTPDQIADHFVSLLERGYLKGNTQEMPNIRTPETAVEREPETKKEQYKKLKDQCMSLIKLIDEIEENHMNAVIDALKFRHACKKFDPEKKIPHKKLGIILEAACLSPSSFGMEAWKFLVLESKEIREQLRPVCWDQAQITDASHVIVILARPSLVAPSNDYVKANFLRRELPEDATLAYIDRYKWHMETEVFPRMSAYAWCAKQCYIALANIMSAAASMGIDSCPMEGFEKDKVETILKIDKKEYEVAVLVALGFRAGGQTPRRRHESKTLIEYR